MPFEAAKARLITRRSVLAAAATAPLLGLAGAVPALANERVGFSDLWTPDFDFSDKAQRLAGIPVEMRG